MRGPAMAPRLLPRGKTPAIEGGHIFLDFIFETAVAF